MRRKKEIAGLAEGSSETRGEQGEADPVAVGNVAIAHLIEQIQVMLTADRMRPSGPATAFCHASLSYVRGHRASNMDVFWRAPSVASGCVPSCPALSRRSGEERRFVYPEERILTFCLD